MRCSAAADGELAAIWIAADDRKAVSGAAYAIEQALGDDPLGCGESREENQRIMFVAPLGVRYVVLQESRSVMIGQFWTF